MAQATLARAEAAARALAMMVAANGRVDAQELLSLDQRNAFAQIGVSRDRFIALAQGCVAELGAQLCERSWLCAEHAAYIDSVLDAVPDAESRALVCHLAAAVIAADGRVTHDERLVYGHALARWRISPAAAVPQTLASPGR